MTTGFTKRVAIQSGVPTRDASGGVRHDTFEDVDGMESIPCTIMPTVDEKRQERFTADREFWEVILAGHWPQITQSMYVLDDEGRRYQVQRCSTTKRRRVTTLLATLGNVTGQDSPGGPP